MGCLITLIMIILGIAIAIECLAYSIGIIIALIIVAAAAIIKAVVDGRRNK